MHIIDFKILNTAIERLLNKELSEFGITYAQATVIGYLKRSGGKDICQKDIEYNLGLSNPTVSSILTRLKEKQLIVTLSSKTDRRYKSVMLTDKALDMAEDISKRIDQITSVLFCGVSKEELDSLDSVIKKMISNIK